MIRFIKQPKKGDKVKCYTTPPRYGIVEEIKVIPFEETECEAVVLIEREPFKDSVKNYYLEPYRCVFLK